MAIPSSATAEQALGFAAEGWHFAVERSGFRVLAAVFRAESSIVGTQPPDIGTVHSAGFWNILPMLLQHFYRNYKGMILVRTQTLMLFSQSG